MMKLMTTLVVLNMALLSCLSFTTQDVSASNGDRFPSTSHTTNMPAQAAKPKANKPRRVVSKIPSEAQQSKPCGLEEKIRIGAKPSGSTGLTVRFDASASIAPCGKIIEWVWHFGDGTTGKGAKVTHTYSTPDTYVVNLIMTDNKGNRNLVRLHHTVRVTKEKITYQTKEVPERYVIPGGELTSDNILNRARILDSDNDGIKNIDDNCIGHYNPDQKDTDGDGHGDVCDPGDNSGSAKPKGASNTKSTDNKLHNRLRR
jgi:PKD repeat protein